MKKIFNNKKTIIGLIIFSILCISLIVFLVYKNNTNSINTSKINKVLLTNKREILKEKKIINNKKFSKDNEYKLYKEYILEIMDYMIRIHEINDSLKKYLDINEIQKAGENELSENEKNISKINKEIKRLKGKYLSKIAGKKKKSLKKEIDKIRIKKCLKFNSKIYDYNKELLSIVSFLNTNKDYYKIEGKNIVFFKRRVFLEYEKLSKNNYYKYKLIDDKEAPIIKAENIAVSVGDKIDLKTKVSCYDEVDDELECSINGDYDLNKEGNYKLKIETKDQSNNVSSKEITLSVVAKNKVYTSNKNPYYAEVIRNQNVVVIYGLDENQEYTKVVKVFVCSVGLNNNTPTGTFTTSDKYIWRSLYGGVYGQYATRIVNSILFHSVPYYTQNKGNIESEEFNKLGNAASMGCVRMTVSDVKWIYDNCPKGMTVKIYDGDLPNGIAKPNAPKIDLNSPNRGWDPTDPDVNNPWKS